MRSVISLLLAVAGLLPGLASAQEVAGRVIAANGAVTVERNLVTLPVTVGNPIQAGDVLNVGTGSTAQLRFTDDSVVALGPDTRFQVAEYAYDGVAATAQRVAMSLLKGGLRTVTGQIGKINNSGYRLTTATATIGIRGTGFSVCQDCTTVQGEFLPGTSIAFSEGAGVLATQAGELPLVAGQSAYARDATTPPVLTPTFPQLRQQASARPSTTTRTAAATGTTAPALSTAVASGDGTTGTTTAGTGATGTSTAGTTSDSSALVVASAAATPLATTSAAPAFQVTSTPVVDTLLAPTSGTSYYRLAGPMNLQVACTPGPCPTVVDGEMIIGVNYSLKRATASASFKLSDGGIFNVGIPIQLSGAPVSIVGNQVTFSGTYNLSDFPQNAGSFACNYCGPTGNAAPIPQLTVSGTISGSQASLTVGVADPSTGESGTFTAPLTQQTPTTNTAAALIVPTFGGGASARSSSGWDVTTDASGRLTKFGPPVGAVQGSVGGATNTVVGSAPDAGNLVWGRWTNGTTAATKATFTDSLYNTFQPGNNSQQQWITGDASPFLPATLGVLNFNLAGSVLTQNAVLNSATLQADMVNRTLALNMNVSASPSPSGTNVYQLNATTGFSPTSNRFSAGFNSVTCSGPCNLGVAKPSGSFGGFFAGPNAEGAGIAFTAGFGPSAGANGVGNGVSGVAGFRR